MIKHGVCLQTLIPMRASASESSELVSQLLFGELYIVDELMLKWAKIISVFDAYVGWIDSKLLNLVSIDQFEMLKLQEKIICSKPISQLLSLRFNSTMPIVAGSALPLNIVNDTFEIANERFALQEKFLKVECSRKNLVDLGMQFLNAPYLWGGMTLLGIDCSGFSQLLYKIIGITLPRDASMQIQKGVEITFIHEALPGDLAFFDNEEGKIIHVGMVLGNSEIIHASGNVRIDKIDHQGIFNIEQKKYTHKLRLIKCLL